MTIRVLSIYAALLAVLLLAVLALQAFAQSESQEPKRLAGCPLTLGEVSNIAYVAWTESKPSLVTAQMTESLPFNVLDAYPDKGRRLTEAEARLFLGDKSIQENTRVALKALYQADVLRYVWLDQREVCHSAVYGVLYSEKLPPTMHGSQFLVGNWFRMNCGEPGINMWVKPRLYVGVKVIQSIESCVCQNEQCNQVAYKASWKWTLGRVFDLASSFLPEEFLSGTDMVTLKTNPETKWQLDMATSSHFLGTPFGGK